MLSPCREAHAVSRRNRRVTVRRLMPAARARSSNVSAQKADQNAMPKPSVAPSRNWLSALRSARSAACRRTTSHYNRLADGVIYLLIIYAKSVQDNISPKALKAIQETING